MYKSEDGKTLIWYGASLSTPYEGWPCLSDGSVKKQTPYMPGIMSENQVKALGEDKGSTIECSLLVTSGVGATDKHAYKARLRNLLSDMSNDAERLK